MSYPSDYWQTKYRTESKKSWNLFYKRNETRFFKDRHWTWREFPILLEQDNKSILEIGCGVGNFVVPFIQERIAQGGAATDFFVWSCDFSEKAIELLTERIASLGCTQYCSPFVCDVTAQDCFHGIIPNQVDIVTCIFLLSALVPEKIDQALCNIRAVLKIGGHVIVRDYSIGDAAQQRFGDDRRLSPNLFVRQDGTFANYFGHEEFCQRLVGLGFTVRDSQIKNQKTTNVAMNLSQDRSFLQIIAQNTGTAGVFTSN